MWTQCTKTKTRTSTRFCTYSLNHDGPCSFELPGSIVKLVALVQESARVHSDDGNPKMSTHVLQVLDTALVTWPAKKKILQAAARWHRTELMASTLNSRE